MSNGKFWREVDQMLERAAKATTAREVLEACGGSDKTNGFFPGSGGDTQLCERLGRGWRIYFIDGDYYWVARDPQGAWLTYVEGDVYEGLTDYAARELEEALGESIETYGQMLNN